MIKKVLVVALAATAALALETHTDGRQNLGERGVDCGWDSVNECNCFTDVTRTPIPPTLVDDNLNATAGSAETGIDGDDIRLVFNLDFSVFGQDDVLGGAETELNAGGHLLANATEWEPATQNVYKKPEIWFVNYAAGTDDRIDAATCPLGATITETKIYPAIYGSNGDDCGDFQISTEANLRDTLRECGWIKQPTLVQGTGPDSAQFYQVYDGKLKVQTDRHNGALRSAEVILRQEFPFWISIQYPTVVTVTSSNVSVIGAVVEQAALTHQIWDSSAGHVDLNAFVGVSYPYALADSEFADSVGAPGQDLQTRLVLNLSAGEGSCAKWVPVGGWKVGTDGVNYTCAGGAGDQTTAKYRAGVLCDRSAYGLVGQCDLADFFDLTGGEFGASTNDYEVQQSAGYKNLFANSGEIFDSPGSGLPTTNCSATNIGTANAKACKQNLHLRLTPRSGWCDLNVRLVLTQGVVCRDDAYGNDTHSHTWVPNGNAVAAVSGTTGRLLTPGGAVLPCSSLAAPDKEVGLIFSLASDDFCARVIETATLTSSLSVYQSEATSANWGAHCADAAACTGTASSAAACGDGTTDPTEELCRQIPGLFPETSATTGLTAQQRQTQASFVFGTTSYLETRVFAPSGINIDTTTISELWVTKSDVATFPTASNEDRQDLLAGNWAKLLAQYSSGSYSALSLVSYKTGTSDAIGSRVAISNKISGTSTSGVDSLITGKADYFVDTTKANPAATGSDAAKLGKHFEGVSRASVLLDEYTVHITDPLEEAAESIKFWARITITYKAAANQETLGADEVTTQAEAPAGSSSRARLAAAPALTGRSVSAQAGVTPAGTSGAAGGSSTIAGVSATTVVAATVVVGAVVVAAGVGLFVARRRRTAQRATKRTSSTQELNDTAQVQV